MSKKYEGFDNFPLERYTYKVYGNRVIAYTTYAGKKVYGKAVCHGDDEFDLELGKKLAAYRCNQKVAMRRLHRANKMMASSKVLFELYKQQLEKDTEYFNDACAAVRSADAKVIEIEKEIR